MKLSVEAVDKIFTDCFPPHGGDLLVEGIVHKVKFSSSKISEHKSEISELLGQLPDSFQEKKGGGMSFLEACLDKDGVQWTGEHFQMEKLFLLGMAAGLVVYGFPREVWSALPGCVPYLTVKEH